MSPMQNKKQETKADPELERLKEQVKRAEEKGLTDTCHHEMLRRATESAKEE